MQETMWDSSNLEDRNLVSRSKDGDHAAFEALVSKYQRQLTALVHRYAGPSTDKEDLLQVLLCKIYFSLNSFDTDRPFYPWLRRIAVNLCCDERRRLRRRARTFTELEDPEIDTRHSTSFVNSYSAASRQEMNVILQQAIGLLPRRDQEVIALHHLQQRPYEEIGAILKCTTRTARVRAFRARVALRRLLEEGTAQPRYSAAAAII